MIGIITLLMIACFASMLYSFYMIYYSMKATTFLEYAKEVITENDDTEELDTLVKEDMPTIEEYFMASKGMAMFSFLTIVVNAFGIIFDMFPELYETTAWTITMWLMALTNSSVLISLFSFSTVKAEINATCESYNLIIQSYDYMKEYEEDNNDSSDRF